MAADSFLVDELGRGVHATVAHPRCVLGEDRACHRTWMEHYSGDFESSASNSET